MKSRHTRLCLRRGRTFVIGATMGATLAGPLHMSPALLAACGLSTLFTTTAQVSMTGVVLATELFGWHATIPAAMVALAARVAVGQQGLYVNRHEIADRPGAAPVPNR